MTRRERPRPFVRRKGVAQRKDRSAVSRLASCAGLATVERLEARQLLFSLTVTPSSVGPDGLGTVAAIFGYTIPNLNTATTPNVSATSETREEDFSDQLPRNIPPNTELEDSFLRIRHNVIPPADVRIVADVAADGQVVQGSERLRVRLADAGEFISFEFDVETDTGVATDDPDLPLQSLVFDVNRTSGPFGLPFNSVTVTLTLRGAVVATFTGAALQARNIGAATGADFAAGIGTFSFTTADPLIDSPFDRLVITATPGDVNAFELDNFAAAAPPPVFVDIIEERIFGAEIRLTGPVGATVQVLDLYGRSMVPTIALGTPDGIDNLVLVDIDSNGVPDFNDGIGEIRLSNTDSRTVLTVFGGTIEAGPTDGASTNPLNLPGGVYQEGAGDFAFTYTRVEEFIGLFDEFEDVGFGYLYDGEAEVGSGLPDGQGSVIIGSPFVRNNSSQATYNPGGPVISPDVQGGVVTGQFAFVRPNQGVKVVDGSAMGRITIHGVVHGTTVLPTTIETLNYGLLMGSITVGGDAGAIVIASDAGIWSPDVGVNTPGAPAENKTNSQITIGRTVNEILIGGRLSSDITVLGDLSDPVNRPARDVLRYTEKEFILPVSATSGLTEAGLISNFIQRSGGNQSLLFGASLFRNDTIIGAEWVGSAATAVEISGNLGIGDPAIHSEDPGDVYAFAANIGVPVTVNSNNRDVEIRIVDRDGRTLAAADDRFFGVAGRAFTFVPEAPGVYYLVVQAVASFDGTLEQGQAYVVAMNGIAPTLLGSVRTGAGTAQNPAAAGSVTLLAGDAGQIVFGAGLLDPDGDLISATVIANDSQGDVDDFHSLQSGVYTISGTLHNFTVGSDIQGSSIATPVRLNVGGNLALMATGVNPLVAGRGDFTNGDVGNFVVTVGGDVGIVDIQGAIGIDQDQTGFSPFQSGIILRTGDALNQGLAATGSIGYFRVGGAILGRDSLIQVPNNATIGAFLVNQDNFIDPAVDTNIGFVNGQLSTSQIFSMGLGADIRFMDVPSIDLQGNQNSILPIFVGQTLDLVDDAGALVRISVTGGASVAPIGFARVLPINNSQGVVIAGIEVNLAGGRNLNITSTTAGGAVGPVGIGRINITGATATSDVVISGAVPIDVYRIIQTGGTGINEIRNTTPGGDIIAIDVIALNNLFIQSGDLGFAELPSYGPRRIGPELGVEAGLVEVVGGPLGVNPGNIDGDWNGLVYRPTNDPTDGAGTAYLDDIGGPFDTFLDGLVVRTGDVLQVRVGGAIGDVILQGEASVLRDLRANDDRNISPRFEGIRGVIYAPNIGSIDIGDGIEPLRDTPIANTGIFAEDEIGLVRGVLAGANISSVIVAGNSNVGPTFPGPGPQPTPGGVGGIDRIDLNSGGSFIDAYIGVTEFDFFWQSPTYEDDDVSTGDIREITGNNADMFRTRVDAINIDRITLTNGFFDASQVDADGNLDRISATGYRNSTANGAPSEFRPNFITVGIELNTFTTQTPQGNVSDLLIDVLGRVRTSITANNFIRTDIQVDNRIERLAATSGILGSNIEAGEILLLTAGTNITASNIAVSGNLRTLTAGDSILNSEISITGFNGSLVSVTAARDITGAINSAGPIGSIRATTGDIDLDIFTTGPNGFIDIISAGRDLLLTTDISQGVNALVAGRNIGSPNKSDAIFIRSSLASVRAVNGQLFNDINVGGSLGIARVTVPLVGSTGGAAVPLGVTIGTAVSIPGINQSFGKGSLIAFERVGNVVINGDFGGSIISYSGGIQNVAINNGSTLPGEIIAAYDGSIDNLTITNGHLLSDVLAGIDITRLSVTGTGVFGNVGINPALNPLTAVSANRSQLPIEAVPTNQIDGPLISAGRDIVALLVPNGSMFEAGVYAGRNIVNATIGGSVLSDDGSRGGKHVSFFAAGDQVQNVAISGSVEDTLFIAGIFDLGANMRPGGVGPNADTVKSGIVNSVTIGGSATNTDVVAGMLAGPDGVYATGNETTALGFSTVNTFTVAGAVTNVAVTADVIPGGLNPAFNTFGGQFPVENPLVFNGAAPGNNANGLSRQLDSGERFVATLTGPGTVTYSAALDTLFIAGTTTASSLTIQATSPSNGLTSLTVSSQDNAALGSLVVNGDLLGASTIVIDGQVNSATFGRINTTGSIIVGGDLLAFTATDFTAGFLRAANSNTFTITGNYGSTTASIRGEAKIDLLNAGTITIGGAMRADLNVARNATRLVVNGGVDTALIRIGGNLGATILTTPTVTSANAAFSTASMNRSRISVGNNLGSVFVAGNAFQSAIIVGADLGADADFGGVGLNADRATSGSAGTIFIGGNFFESNIIAGALRGPDGFYGTADDVLAPGRSNLGNITIAGSGVGSTRFTESYRILATGNIGNISIGGAPGANQGNFAIESRLTQPTPIQVTNLTVSRSGPVYTARITFNQPVDVNSLSDALSVREVRGQSGSVQIFLIEGLDYTLSYEQSTNTALVRFDRVITERDLPQLPGVPGPGIYRFQIEPEILTGRLAGAVLDGNNDGVPGDRFSRDAVVGDAGDKLVSGTGFLFDPFTGEQSAAVDFYPPINLDTLLDDNLASNGLAEVNTVFTIRGFIGDHPDHTDGFLFASDVDLYTITLQAGQILRLGPIEGSATATQLNVLTPSGQVGIAGNADALRLPSRIGIRGASSFEQVYLINTTAQYVIAVGNTTADLGDPTSIPNIPGAGGTTGEYRFTLEVFDDGNSGFADATDSGSARNVVTAPIPLDFAGPDRVFGTSDDRIDQQIFRQDFAFTLDVGPDGIPGTADDIVTGMSADGRITSTRANGELVSVISGAIGPEGHRGVPNTVFADVDVYNLNGGNPIAPGTLVTVHVGLSKFGADLGSRGPDLGPDSDFSFLPFGDNVQFGVFDATNATNLTNASILFSPSDFSSNGGTPGIIAERGPNRYGFDDNGDFFITFAAPGRLGSTGLLPARYAIYLQGVFNTDYEITVTTRGVVPIVLESQNVLIETGGGTIDWLRAGGAITQLAGFDPATLGVVGSMASGQSVEDFLLSGLVANLQSVFNAAGVAVNFSLTPADFEFQDFSTVFLTSSVDPISDLFAQFGLGAFGIRPGDGPQTFTTQPFGFAERSDPLNTDSSDEAVVFLPSHAQLGLTPSQNDIEQLLVSLTATVGRHVGELLGLQASAPVGPGGIADIQAANSPFARPQTGAGYTLPTLNRALSGPFDQFTGTDFWLGQQNAGALLDRILAG